MADHLWPLLRLPGNSEIALQEAYRQLYLFTYIRNEQGQEVVIRDWLGNRIRFFARDFDHAFSESSNYRVSSGIHDKPFSKKRARHILWIKEVVAGTKGTIQRRQQIRNDNRGRPTFRRVFLVMEERYLVVLKKGNLDDEWNFLTAFPADQSYFEKIQREGVLQEIRKPQS